MALLDCHFSLEVLALYFLFAGSSEIQRQSTDHEALLVRTLITYTAAPTDTAIKEDVISYVF
jgi:hypothetical protein